MNPDDISKLVTYIEENLRASSSVGLSFVDSRHHKTRLLSNQNHVVFGRRGAGKTTLVNATKETENQITIYLNLEDFKDIAFPNIIIHILMQLFSTLADKINKAYPWYKFYNRKERGTLKKIQTISESLNKYLHDPDIEIQSVSVIDAYHEEISAKAGTPSVSGGAKTKREKSSEVKREIPKNKVEYLRLELTTYKELISAVSNIFKQKPIFLIFDDFYFVPKLIQPDLIDYFHRLTKGTALFIKMATIKNRSKLYRRTTEQYVGVELEHDIFEVNMDYTLDDFDDLQAFMRNLLENANVKSEANLKLNDIFAGDGFSQLCLASGGVPRDFLSLFVVLANTAASTSQAIGKVQVTDAAISRIGNKIDSMRVDSGDEDAILEDYLRRIKTMIYSDKRTNAFLVAKDDLEKDPQSRQVLRELVDLRLLHLIDQNTSKASSDGRRYEAYILDIGLYDNARPRSFTQIEPGHRDDKARKDDLRAAPLLNLPKLRAPSASPPIQLNLILSDE